MPRIRFDRSPTSILALCPCGWRGLPTTDQATATRQARHHAARAHVGDFEMYRQVSRMA